MAAGVAPRAPIGHRRLLRIFSGGGRSRRGRRRGCKVGARGLRQLPARRGASFRVVDILIIFIPLPPPHTHTHFFPFIHPPPGRAGRGGRATGRAERRRGNAVLRSHSARSSSRSSRSYLVSEKVFVARLCPAPVAH